MSFITHNKKRILNVFIASRDRPILTEKTIDSIYDNSTIFDKIYISCYDNLSLPDQNRFSMFSRLLSDGKIHFYSYDTNYSVGECFPKAVEVNRWMNSMVLNFNMAKIWDPTGINQQYFMLIDNDMLLGPDWDKVFVSSIDSYHSKDLYFITQFPGGITARGGNRDMSKTEQFTIKNKFSNSTFDFITASRGGSSGFWFMDIEMIKKLIWKDSMYIEVFRRYKKQDSATWKMIIEKHGRDYKYVGAVVPEPGAPYVVHLGDYVGSICKSEMMKKYGSEKKQFMYKEEVRFKNKNHREIYEEFKEKGSQW